MTTQSKHTPGPWRVRNDAKDWAIIGAEPSWVTAVDKRNHSAEANAHLIAAAPDMLRALEAIRARIDGDWDHPSLVAMGPLNTDIILDCARYADAAITRARGGQS